MAPPPQGVLFGPIKDWGKGSSKVLLEFEEGGVKWRRQFALEDVTSWHEVPEFGERGTEALVQAGRNSERAKQDWAGEGDWELHISQLERRGRQDEEIIRVRDSSSAERAIEILTRGIAIQDGAINEQLEGLDFEYATEDKEQEILESITVRPVRRDGSLVTSMEHRWVLSTPKGKGGGRPSAGLAGQVTGLERRIEEVEEEGQSDNEAIRVRSRRNGKKPRLEGYFTLGDLEVGLGGDTLEPAVPRTIEEVRGNLFGSPQEADSRTLEEMEVDETGPLVEGREEDVGIEIEVEEVEGPGVRKWKPVWDSREAMTIVYSIKTNGKLIEEIENLKPKERSWESARDVGLARDLIRSGGGSIEGGWYLEGNEAGKGGWRAVSRAVVARGNAEEIELVMEAERTWRSITEVRPGKLMGVERELAEVKKQLAVLAVSLGAVTLEQVAEAKRTINARKGKVEEERRKQEELKKVERKRREDEVGRRQEEKNKEEAVKLAEQARKVKESQQKAKEACEANIQELVNKFRTDLSSKELISLGQRLQEVEDMKKRIEKEAEAPVERSIGQSK
ncbi:hypothetical protein BGX38DRAFT_1334691 [Terfezia claveryi]|nr:hypothetical protein BGX38DRAFT_1334691 [Terfezia claveryi]